MVCGCINTYFGRGAKQIKTTVHILSTSGFYYGRVLHGSVYNDNPANKPTTVNRPKNGVANRLIKRWGIIKYTLTTCITKRWWRKGEAEGKKTRSESLNQNGNGPMNFRVQPVNHYVQVQHTFTVQFPLFQLSQPKARH
jgi:hypothetical protein